MSVDISDLNKKLIRFAEAINDRSINFRLAKKLKEIIYRRVKDGYGTTSESAPAEATERKKLKDLSKSYIDYRKGLVLFFTAKDGHVYPVSSKIKGGKKYRLFQPPKLGEFGRPTKSNATLSGQMLNAIGFSYDDTGFRLYVADTRRAKGELSNGQVSAFYSKNRPYFALTAGELRILQRELENELNRIIKDIF